MVQARTLFVMDDLDLHLQDLDLDLQGHNTLLARNRTIRATFTIFTQDMQHDSGKNAILYG